MPLYPLWITVEKRQTNGSHARKKHSNSPFKQSGYIQFLVEQAIQKKV
jgi:hypothetical protein